MKHIIMRTAFKLALGERSRTQSGGPPTYVAIPPEGVTPTPDSATPRWSAAFRRYPLSNIRARTHNLRQWDISFPSPSGRRCPKGG